MGRKWQDKFQNKKILTYSWHQTQSQAWTSIPIYFILTDLNPKITSGSLVNFLFSSPFFSSLNDNGKTIRIEIYASTLN